ATGFGFLSVGAGLLLSAWLLFNKIANLQFLVSGWTSIVLVVVYFSGVQLITIGILGLYIGSLFDEVKRRPEYSIAETANYVPASDDPAKAQHASAAPTLKVVEKEADSFAPRARNQKAFEP